MAMADASPKYETVRTVKFKIQGRKYRAKLLKSESGSLGLDIQRTNGKPMNTEDDPVGLITRMACKKFGIKQEEE